MKPLKLFLLTILLLTTCLPKFSSAALFGEHKYIGDEAFRKFMLQGIPDSLFFCVMYEMYGMKAYGSDVPVYFNHDPYTRDDYNGVYVLFNNGRTHGISYGDLTGLSGDHSVDPVQIFQALISDGLFTGTNNDVTFALMQGKLEDALIAHHAAIDNGLKEADNNSDLGYLFLALEDKSHFYQKGQTFSEQLEALTPVIALLKGYIDGENKWDTRNKFIVDLLHSNAVAKYAMYHMIALYLMHNAAIKFYRGTHDAVAIAMIKKALLYNAFADHYLEDAFAAGHLPLHRTLISGFNNNGTHDYYNRIGLNVTNRNGYIWTTYGDGYYDSTTYRMAINANVVSLNELWKEFKRTLDIMPKMPEGQVPLSLMDSLANYRIGDRPDSIILKRFAIYSLVPIPFTKEQLKDDLKFSHSRNGFFYEVNYGTLLNKGLDLSANKFGGSVGFGRGNVKPPQDIAHLEYYVWYGGMLEYERANYYADAWNEWTLKAECIIHDKWVLDMAGGIKGMNHSVYPLAVPSIGYELKPVCWMFAPSIKFSVTYATSYQPVYVVQLALRYY